MGARSRRNRIEKGMQRPSKTPFTGIGRMRCDEDLDRRDCRSRKQTEGKG